MAESPIRPKRKDEPEIADAGLLFRDDAPKAKPEAAPIEPVPSAGDDYGLVGGEPETAEDESAPIPPVPPPVARPKPTAKIEEESRPRPKLDPADAVEQVWSRGAEWGGTLGLIGLEILVFGGLVYFLLSLGLLS